MGTEGIPFNYIICWFHPKEGTHQIALRLLSRRLGRGASTLWPGRGRDADAAETRPVPGWALQFHVGKTLPSGDKDQILGQPTPPGSKLGVEDGE